LGFKVTRLYVPDQSR